MEAGADGSVTVGDGGCFIPNLRDSRKITSAPN